MLCPNCGAEVGSALKLCDACEGARQARIEEERKAAEAAAGAQAEAASEAGQKSNEVKAEVASLKRTIYLSVALFAVVLLVFLFAVIMVKYANRQPAPGPLQPTTPAPVAPVRQSSVGHQRSGLKFGETELQLPFSVALFDSSARRVDVAFFKNLPEPIVPDEIVSAGSVESVNGVHADAILSLALKADASACNMTTVQNYQLTIFKGESKFPFDSDKLTFTIRDIVHDPDAAGANLSFDSLSCGFVDGSELKASFSGRKKIAVKDENLSLSWDLRGSSLMIMTSSQLKVPIAAPSEAPAPEVENHPAPFGQVTVDTVQVDVKTVVSLYYPAAGNVGIGFFGEELSQSDIEQIKKRKSLSSFVSGKRPLMVLFLDFGAETPAASIESLKSYTAYFYRDPGGAFSFSGSLDALSFKRTKEQIQPSEFLDLSGGLLPLGQLDVQMRGEGSASGNAAKFHWHIHYRVLPTTVQ